MKPLTLWYMLPAMNVGGAEKHVMHLAAGLRKRGHEAGIVTVFREGALAEEIHSSGIPFVCLHAPEGWGPGTFSAIFRWLKSKKIDVLHTYLFGFHFFAGLPARILKIPVIVSSRREIAQWQRGRHLLVENLGNLVADRVICCSKAVEKWVHSREFVRFTKTLAIYNGVDLERFDGRSVGRRLREELGIPNDAPVIGTVANFSAEKGYPYLAEAASLTFKACPEARFLWVGSGPLQKEIFDSIRKIDRHEQILFTGHRPDVAALLSAMDIFVLPSVLEGFPNVILEAMAMGKPVIATRTGGIPELITSDHEGMLVEPADSRALAESIVRLLGNPEEAHELGRRAQEKVRREYPLQRMVDQYESLYQMLFQHRGGRQFDPPPPREAASAQVSVRS